MCSRVESCVVFRLVCWHVEGCVEGWCVAVLKVVEGCVVLKVGVLVC